MFIHTKFLSFNSAFKIPAFVFKDNYPVSVSTSSIYHSQEDERVAQFSLLKTHFCLGIRLTRVIDDDTKVENIDNITTKQFLEEITWQ